MWIFTLSMKNALFGDVFLIGIFIVLFLMGIFSGILNLELCNGGGALDFLEECPQNLNYHKKFTPISRKLISLSIKEFKNSL